MNKLNLLRLIALLIPAVPLALVAQAPAPETSRNSAATNPPPSIGSRPFPSLDEAMASRTDLWGELAMRQTNGASYEFFAPLLPPLRYVNADFRYYPIVLSAPNAKVKARLISNGSGVNLRGGARSLERRRHAGPIPRRPGRIPLRRPARPRDRTDARRGLAAHRRDSLPHPPRCSREAWCRWPSPRPSVPPEIYRLEAFASTAPAFASNCVVFVKFDLAQGTNGYVAVEVDARRPLKFEDGRLLDDQGRVLALFDSSWKWERGRAVARLTPGRRGHPGRSHAAAGCLRAARAVVRHLRRTARSLCRRPGATSSPA